MTKKVEEKQKSNTKFNLDNEIIIGIKTLPETAPKKKKKTKTTLKKTKKNTKRSNKIKNEEFELKLGIEDEQLKQKRAAPKKLTKKQEIAKKKRKTAFKLIKWTSIILILIGGGIYFLLSSFFNIKNIEVTGNTKLTSQEIISLSQIQLDENTFKIVKSKIEKNIKQNAYIEKVDIKRKLPNTISIEIQERVPTYIISFANAYVYINNQGYFLEISKDKPKLPMITGYLTKEEDIHEGGRLNLDDLQRLEAVLQIMKSAESNGVNELITKINISDKQDYILELTEEKKTVHIGDTSNLSTKMLYIKKIIDQNKNVEGEILVNTDLNNKGAIFRKKV